MTSQEHRGRTDEEGGNRAQAERDRSPPAQGLREIA